MGRRNFRNDFSRQRRSRLLEKRKRFLSGLNLFIKVRICLQDALSEACHLERYVSALDHLTDAKGSGLSEIAVLLASLCLSSALCSMGVRKGCYDCNKRRIICDETEPQCLKCVKKGLQCSGMGLRYRFNDGVASRGKLKGLSIPVLPPADSGTKRQDGPATENHQVVHSQRPQIQNSNLRFIGEKGRSPPSKSRATGRNVENIWPNDIETRIFPPLQLASSKVELLLSHCTFMWAD